MLQMMNYLRQNTKFDWCKRNILNIFIPKASTTFPTVPHLHHNLTKLHLAGNYDGIVT